MQDRQLDLSARPLPSLASFRGCLGATARSSGAREAALSQKLPLVEFV